MPRASARCRAGDLSAVWVPAVLGKADRVFIHLDWIDAEAEDHPTRMATGQAPPGGGGR